MQFEALLELIKLLDDFDIAVYTGHELSDVPKELLDEVRELFERADFVKFAKFVASDDDNASVLPLAVRFVTETYQTDVEADSHDTVDGTSSRGAEATWQSKDGGNE